MPLAWIAIYLLAVPVMLGLISGVNEAGSARMVSKEWYILRYTTRGLLSWWVQIASAFALVALLKPWQPRFLTVMVIAPVVTIVLNAPLSLVWQPLFEPYLAEGSKFYPLWPWRFSDPEYLSEGLFALTTNELVWVTFNYVLWRGLGFTLYGYPPPDGAGRMAAPTAALSNSPAAPGYTPTFIDRVPKEIGTDVIVLEAQEHYTKVHTRSGTALILYRFGDAMKEMVHTNGLQVHRSFWVNADAIAAVTKLTRTYELTMDTGLKVPVSRSYKVKVDELGLVEATA